MTPEPDNRAIRSTRLQYRIESRILSTYGIIDNAVYRSLTTYPLCSPMLRFVYDNIKLFNVRERRVHLTEVSPKGFVQNVHCIL